MSAIPTKLLSLFLASLLIMDAAQADVTVPNIFSDHMVLQQKQTNKIWGKADVGELVTITIDEQSIATTADENGMWVAKIAPLDAGGPYDLVVKGKNEIKIADVLVGEVWICSGQSNMEWPVARVEDQDLERISANYPKIRMINYPNTGSQTPIWTHENSAWMVCSPETVDGFSGVGYFFGRQIFEAIDVPIGLINNSWGGSAVDAWINRELLDRDDSYQQSMASWKENEATFEALSAKEELTTEESQQLANLRRQMAGNSRPGNLYNGILKSHLGYGIRGAIWYQGESNAGRAYQYREIFPLMIDSWRMEWGQGDFPFYWVQLADYMAEEAEPNESAWAELREAQTMTMSKLPNTGEAVIIDIGEGKDIHPRNKVRVGQRLARWALVKQYGFDIAYQSPTYKSMEKNDGKIVLSFEHVDGGWRPFDVKEPVGFAIAGEDKKFVWADAKLIEGDRIEVSSAQVPEPVTVRYAWANNPVCNMFDTVGLPLTPFRTDDWPGVTADNFVR